MSRVAQLAVRSVTSFALVATLAVIAVTIPAVAGPRNQPTGGEPKPQPRTPQNPPAGGGAPRNPGSSSNPKGYIEDFKPSKETGDDDTVVGILTFRPDIKDAKPLKLRVHRGFEYKVGDSKIEAESALDLMWKGLYATATWNAPVTDPKKKPLANHGDLVSLSIECVETEGVLDEIAEDSITVTVKPMKGDWPDADLGKKPSNTNPPPNAVVKPPRSRKLKVKTLERVTRYLNEDLRLAEQSEFNAGQKIEAYIGFAKGKATCILLNLRPPIKKFGSDPNPKPGAKIPTPPKPPGSRPHPGG